MITVEFDFSSIAAKLDKVTEAAQEAVRPAAQAGAQVFYDEVKLRAPESAKAHSTKNKKLTYQPGNLKKAIYQAFADKQSTDDRAVYRISWNKDKAFYGRFIEFGTSRMPARPFLRPAFDAMQSRAVEAVEAKMFERLKEAIA